MISVAKDGRELASFRGEAEGVLLRSPQGNNGFGYDPLFWYAPLGKTFAELSAEEKAAVSHRGNAIRKFLAWCQARSGAKQSFARGIGDGAARSWCFIRHI